MWQIEILSNDTNKPELNEDKTEFQKIIANLISGFGTFGV
jgi:hypothetical protein